MSRKTLGLVAVVAFTVLSVASTSSEPAPDDGYRTVSFRVENHYAESLFTLSYEIELPEGTSEDGEPWEVRDGPAEGTVLEQKRLDAYDRETVSDVVTVPVGSRVHVTLVARSLGDDYVFDELEDPDDGAPGLVVTDSRSQTTLVLEYDYDLANAAFSVSYGWRY